MVTDGTHPDSRSAESAAPSSSTPSRTGSCELDAYLSPTADFLLLLAVALTVAVACAAIFIP